MPLHDFTKYLKVYEYFFLFRDFSWNDYLSLLDDLIRVAKYGSYESLINLTPREIHNIATVIGNKNRQETLEGATKGGNLPNNGAGLDLDDLLG